MSLQLAKKYQQASTSSTPNVPLTGLTGSASTCSLSRGAISTFNKRSDCHQLWQFPLLSNHDHTPALNKFGYAFKDDKKLRQGNRKRPGPEAAAIPTDPKEESLSAIVPDIEMAVDPLIDEDLVYGSGTLVAAACSGSTGGHEDASLQDPPPPHERFTNFKSKKSKSAAAIYASGKRSVRLLNMVWRTRGRQPSMETILGGAQLVLGLWEENGGGNQDWYRRLNNLANFMAGLVIRTSVSPLTFLVAFYYIDRLRHTYPMTTGGSGCATRIFSVALMVSTRYLELPMLKASNTKLQSSLNRIEEWSDTRFWSGVCGGVFGADEMDRMEAELILFLKHDLYISHADFEYFVLENFLKSPTIVPTNNDGWWLKEILSLTPIMESGETSVPEQDFPILM